MKISAIIPAYNAAPFLVRSVESLVATGYPDLEILVVDDGSSDGTLDVATQLADRYPEKVRVLHHPAHANKGVSASRNLGIEKSTGELICFLDADDYVFPHRFETSVPILEKDETVDGVYELCTIVLEGKAEESKFWNDSVLFGITKPAADQLTLLKIILGGTPWATSVILFRRSLLEKSGVFNKDFQFAEDCHLWFRMASVGKIVQGNMSEPVSAYCRHGSNAFKYLPERRVDMVRAMADVCNWVSKKKLSNGIRKAFICGVQKYLINGIIVMRESGRYDIAWKISVAALSAGNINLLVNLTLLKQMLAVGWEYMLGFKSEKKIP